MTARVLSLLYLFKTKHEKDSEYNEKVIKDVNK